MISRHFECRAKQRGIDKESFRLITTFGVESKNIARRVAIRLSKKDVDLIQADLKRLIRLLDKNKNTQIVQSEDGTYITVLK